MRQSLNQAIQVLLLAPSLILCMTLGKSFFLSLTSVSLSKWGKQETALVTHVDICQSSVEELNVITAILAALKIVRNFWWSSNSQK